MPCCCFKDEENQNLGIVLCHYQFGCFPIKCFDYDNNGMCWGGVCCGYQVDPCWCFRQALHLCCMIVPCGCIGKELIFTIFCCNPGRASQDPFEAQKAAGK